MHMRFNTLQLLPLYKFYCLFSNSAKIIDFNKKFMHCQGMVFQNIGPSKIFLYKHKYFTLFKIHNYLILTITFIHKMIT